MSPFLCFSVSLSLSLSLGLWAGASRSCPGSPRGAGWGRGAGLLGGAGGGEVWPPRLPAPSGAARRASADALWSRRWLRLGLGKSGPGRRRRGQGSRWEAPRAGGDSEEHGPGGPTPRRLGPSAPRHPPPSSRISCDPSPDPSGQGGLECSRAARGERPARRPAPIPAPTAAPTTPRFPPPPAPPRLLAPRAAPGLRALGGQQGGAAQGLAGPLAAPEAAAAGGSSGRKAAGRARAQGAPAAGARHRGLGAREPRAGRRGAAS